MLYTNVTQGRPVDVIPIQLAVWVGDLPVATARMSGPSAARSGWHEQVCQLRRSNTKHTFMQDTQNGYISPGTQGCKVQVQ